MYTFPSRSGQSLSLRPENTACKIMKMKRHIVSITKLVTTSNLWNFFLAAIVRAVLSRNLLHQERKPLKLYYCGPMFRYERPQKGRYRQFNQFGMDSTSFDCAIIGSMLFWVP